MTIILNYPDLIGTVETETTTTATIETITNL